MTAAQIVTVPSVKPVPLYPFLNQHPPQKKRPTPAQPLPSPPTGKLTNPGAFVAGRRRSATTSAISSWVANVHPGSPAPCSPRRSPSAWSNSHRSSNLSWTPRKASASFLHITTPVCGSKISAITPITPSFQDVKYDLTAIGYTSVFVHFPNTPATPAWNTQLPTSPALPPSPVKGSAGKNLKHFRSLGALKSNRRARSRVPPSPAATNVKMSMDAKRARALASTTVADLKKSKYTKMRPAPLANELALAQLIDGGSIEDHAKRYAEGQAKAAGANKVDGQLVGVGDVYRDGEGGIWMDEDEEWEYAHLLGGDEDFCMSEVSWVRFGSDAGNGTPTSDRESLTTQDSDLSARYVMNVENESRDDLAVFGGNVAPSVLIKPGMSVLAIPSRSSRTAKHLNKPEFLLDVFPVPASPAVPGMPVPKTPISPRISTFAVGKSSAARSKGKVRRRPAPLALPPRSPALKCAINSADPNQIRKDFLQDSFAPRPRRIVRPQAFPFVVSPDNDYQVPLLPALPSPVKTQAQKPISKSAMSGVRGFFRAMGGKKSNVV